MYKIDRVVVNDFWGKYKAECSFDHQVNIIIGKNGTGKTTFMNILEAVLSVDMDNIINHEFSSVEIYLSNGSKKRTIKAKKNEDDSLPFGFIEYRVSNKKYSLRMISPDERRYVGPFRRRMLEEVGKLREALSKIVSIASISVYRLRNDDEQDFRDRSHARLDSPVDQRLNKLMESLTRYQLTLSQEARYVAQDLQKEVLASILYSEEDAEDKSYKLEFDKSKEREDLVSAYHQLNAIDKRIRKKIDFHVDYIDDTVEKLKISAARVQGDSEEDSVTRSSEDIDIRSLESLRKSRKIVEMSLDAERKTEEIYFQFNLFLDTVRSFIEDKRIDFKDGSLVVHNGRNGISHDKLSSGEKQLLILLVEALLQHQKPHVFLADEPEISLHIEWQSQIIPAVVKLNPNAQVVVATHSPEVASCYPDSIYDMEDVVHG